MTVPPRDPGIAAVLSFFVCGLGQMYNGQIGKGLLMLAAFAAVVALTALAAAAESTLCLLTGAGAAGLWIFGIVDGKDAALRTHHLEEPGS